MKRYTYSYFVTYIIYASITAVLVVLILFALSQAAGAAPSPKVSFSVNPTSITSGESVALSWSSTDATYCVASEGWRGFLSRFGARNDKPTESTGYVVTCTGPGGSASARRTVSVSGQPLRGGTSFSGSSGGDGFGGVQLSVSPNTISPGESVTLAWSAPDFASCHAAGGWSGTLFTSGTRSVSPTRTTTYELLCIGGGQGSGSDSETVLVVGDIVVITPVASVPLTASCLVDPISTTVGKSVTLVAGSVGGSGVVTYQWRGAVDGVGKIRTVAFDTTGTKVTTVTATDSESNTALASCSATVLKSVPVVPALPPAPVVPDVQSRSAIDLAKFQADVDAICTAYGYTRESCSVDIAEGSTGPDQVIGEDQIELEKSFFATLIFGGGDTAPGLRFFLVMVAVIVAVFITAVIAHRIFVRKQKVFQEQELTKPL